MPERAIQTASPRHFSATVLPPAFGPEITSAGPPRTLTSFGDDRDAARHEQRVADLSQLDASSGLGLDHGRLGVRGPEREALPGDPPRSRRRARARCSSAWLATGA
jgi:hypothetical protein